MSDAQRHEAQIVRCWELNATAWTAAVRTGGIPSRRLVTDQAILAAVASCAPRNVLDIGCGEGWLARVLAAQGIAVLGVDVVPELIAQARAASGGDFRCLSYEALAAGELGQRVDLAVCNFSLLGKESTEQLVGAMPALLEPGGQLVVQTLHPLVAGGAAPYRDGWRPGSWDGFGAQFRDPAPWYFRTLSSWIALFEASGLQLRALQEPLHPDTERPASVIFIAQPRR
jgi:2-polyprenyl-3-methyl-5-hydroxy-6-metoxy-1,4-benzoquinol methylase